MLARYAFWTILLAPLASSVAGELLPRASEPVEVVLPDFGAEVRAFDAPDRRPVAWWPHVVNAAWGGGRGGPERRGGWLDEHWEMVDYLDRSADYTTHEYLKHRGIWYEVYGSNEYQETIHFHEEGARELLWENGIARDMLGKHVLSEHYNTGVDWWRERIGWDAYIVCNNAPRWWSVINYDWLTSPLLGFAISQDNIGGPTSRIGAGGHGRYCDYCNAKFFHHLAQADRLPEFRRQYKHIRGYVQANMMDVVHQLPPHAQHRWNAAEAELMARMCEPPVMSEYHKFLYISHLHNFIRHYQDAKLIAQRQGRQYDVHGNQGGSFIGPNPYQVALSDFVDTVWFESKGISTYDMFKFGWNNASGAFRYKMGRAMTRGVKPFMSMTGFHKHTADIVEHEMAEACAGGGVLFVNQQAFEQEPILLDKLTEYFRLRHNHRAIYANHTKQPYARVALAYSIPTMMYRNYQYTGDAPPNNALPGTARALEEGHIPFEVVILNHPEIHADRVTLEQLKLYRMIILPALECLSDAQIDLFTRYVQTGGTLGLIGKSGIRDENNLPRSGSAEPQWQKAGRVIDILPGRNFLPTRTRENDQTRELTAVALEALRQGLDSDTIISGNLPRLLWINTWNHGNDFISVHFVNYNVDFESGNATPTESAEVTVTLPPDIPAEQAAWLGPDGTRRTLRMVVQGTKVTVTLPPVRVYGVLIVGRKELDRAYNSLVRGDALMARATMACDGQWNELEDRADALAARRTVVATELNRNGGVAAAEDYARQASALIQEIQRSQDVAYMCRVSESVNTDGAVLALDFGGSREQPLWRIVEPTTTYDPQTGFGWLPWNDETDATPEERYYAMAQKYGGSMATQVTAGRLLFWPYRQPPPAPLSTNLACGMSRRFRIDIEPGDYTVRVVTTNPSWTNRNFFVSGMVRLNDEYRLLDAVHDKGTLESREFFVKTPDGKLDFTFGGPTGWGVAALIIRRGGRSTSDHQTTEGLRAWHVSPRFANPDWYPITQVTCPPERRLASLPEADWTMIKAPVAGLPVVDMGTNRQAEIGDVVYAATTIESPTARDVHFHFGATSQAQLWLNGKSIGYAPNEKGLRRDELVVPVHLAEGENTLVVKIQRFWERRWMFYASLTDGGD